MHSRSTVWIVVALSLSTLAGGLAIGYVIWGTSSSIHPDGTASAAEDRDDEDDHVEISAAAARNLGLRLEPVSLQTYHQRLHIPAVVIEKPGQSGLAVTSPTQGIVRQIHKFPGQALELGDLLFTIQVADEALEAAQMSLLETLTQITVTEREIERLDRWPTLF